MTKSKLHGWFILLIGWLGVALACNLPLQQRTEPLRPPTLPAESADLPDNGSEDQNPVPTATLLPAAGSSGGNDGGSIELAPTVTPRSTPSGQFESGDATELKLEYEISWELNQSDSAFALATVALKATGGDGEYTYYRDDVPTGGPQFVYRWGSCKQNPGSFRVDSGDGQSVQIDYFEETPCP